jgi:threonine/homoserine/homoserine lactone efflux protein
VGWSLMITTLKPTTGRHLHATGASSVAPMTAATAREVPGSGSNQGLPFVIGALLGLLVVLALAVWAYLMLSGGDYSGVIDLTQEFAR